MINNKELVFSYVAKLIADGTKYHEHIKESDNIGYIDDAVDELLKTKLSEQEQELPTDIQIIRLTERTKIELCIILKKSAVFFTSFC